MCVYMCTHKAIKPEESTGFLQVVVSCLLGVLGMDLQFSLSVSVLLHWAAPQVLSVCLKKHFYFSKFFWILGMKSRPLHMLSTRAICKLYTFSPKINFEKKTWGPLNCNQYWWSGNENITVLCCLLPGEGALVEFRMCWTGNSLC